MPPAGKLAQHPKPTHRAETQNQEATYAAPWPRIKYNNGWLVFTS
ncbi:hypothetical protein SAMN04488109_0840 [Chryseolinea serpens]|uniref:Uncharacterized protein n=1 Tax=Chryseolinea serpens TaxID=947013 RepID=A0A1M5KUV6_9BACT|nr:hypothetical protein SAMN04488109_0840 [Chryseolinea serpens]